MRVNQKIQFALLGLLLAGAAAAQPAPPVPEGYTAVPFVSEQPEQSFTAAEQVLEPGKDYGAVIATSKGTITIDLAEAAAPETVNNFVFLSLHRFYEGIVFHRVLDGFMAQTGDPTGTGTGDPGYLFADEFAEGVYFDKPGVVAMANAGPGTSTNGSQFFITFLATPHLDGLHTIFGEVTAGMSVLERLQRIDPSRPDTILEPWRLLTYVRQQGVELQGDPQQRLEDYLTETLGKFPEVGETFEIDGASAVIGQGQDEPLVGFFPKPDIIESVTIIERDAQQ